MDRTVAVVGVPAPLGPALVRSFVGAGDEVVLVGPPGLAPERAVCLAADLRGDGGRVVAVSGSEAGHRSATARRRATMAGRRSTTAGRRATTAGHRSTTDDVRAVTAERGTVPGEHQGTAAEHGGPPTEYRAVRDAFGRLDVLVCGARPETAAGTEPSDDPLDGFDRAWRGSARAGYRWVRGTAPDLRVGGGAVLFVGPPGAGAGVDASRRAGDRPGPDDHSPTGDRPDPAAVSAAATATRGLARALDPLLAPDGVRVAHVALGGPREGREGDAGLPGDPAGTAGAVRRVLRREDWSPAVDVVAGEDGPVVVAAGGKR